MKWFAKGIGLIAGLGLTFALLLFAVEFVAYGIDGFYETEYAKYGVLEDVQMEMEDLLYVTDEMMEYLRGDRDDLVVETVVAGEEREFFNEKEKRHMVDVQELFLAGMSARWICVIFALVAGSFFYIKKRGNTYLGGIQWGVGLFLAGIASLCLLMMQDFNKYFTQFHLIFFDNDDWILNPQTDLLINIVPEGFFRDIAFLIAGIFLATAAILWIGSGIWKKRIHRSLMQVEGLEQDRGM